MNLATTIAEMRRLHELIFGNGLADDCALVVIIYMLYRIASHHGVKFDIHLWRNGKDRT